MLGLMVTQRDAEAWGTPMLKPRQDEAHGAKMVAPERHHGALLVFTEPLELAVRQHSLHVRQVRDAKDDSLRGADDYVVE